MRAPKWEPPHPDVITAIAAVLQRKLDEEGWAGILTANTTVQVPADGPGAATLFADIMPIDMTPEEFERLADATQQRRTERL